MPELAAFLLDGIEKTTDLGCLDYIGKVIALDKQMDALYLSNPQVVQILRRAWIEKREALENVKCDQ